MSEYTEQFRLDQGGMGFLQAHAAITWIREWLKHVKVDYDESPICGAHPVLWTIKHPGKPDFYIGFDLKSVGHLLYSIDRVKWQGMDVTYHPANVEPVSTDNWFNLVRRIKRLRSES